MTTRVIKAFLPIALLLLSGICTQVFAGKIELDNGSTTTLSQPQNPLIFHHEQFSRFSLNGDLVQTSTGSGSAFVEVYSLSDYGITSQNIGQLGSLLQIQVTSNLNPFVQVFFINPATPLDPNTWITLGPPQTGGPTLFSLSDFGVIPQNLTPDFFIHVSAQTFTTNPANTSGSLRILSLVAVPEPASIALFVSGLSGLGLLVRRQRSRSANLKD